MRMIVNYELRRMYEAEKSCTSEQSNMTYNSSQPHLHLAQIIAHSGEVRYDLVPTLTSPIIYMIMSLDILL